MIIDLKVNSSHKLRVQLWDSIEEMHRDIRGSDGAAGYYFPVPYTMYTDEEGEPSHVEFPEICGYVHIATDYLGAGTFAHELQHFVLDWALAHGKVEPQYREEVCNLTGRMTIEFWNRWYDSRSGEHCQRCGRAYQEVWWAPDDIWEKVSGDYNLLCPTCFEDLAREKNVYLHWGCAAERYPLETELLALETRVVSAGELIDHLQAQNAYLKEKLCERS